MSKFRSYTAGFIFGSLTAAICVLLNAPKSGKELRHDMSEAKNRFISTTAQLKKDSADLKTDLLRLTKDGKETIKGVTRELKTAVNDWREEIHPEIQRLQKDIAALKEKASKSAKANDNQ